MAKYILGDKFLLSWCGQSYTRTIIGVRTRVKHTYYLTVASIESGHDGSSSYPRCQEVLEEYSSLQSRQKRCWVFNEEELEEYVRVL